MYVDVQPTGTIVFRYDYRLNDRRETLTLGRYGRSGISLARAREMLIDARRMVAEGRSPAHEKTRQNRRLKEAKSFGEFGERYFREAQMADSTRAMRRAIYERDILPKFRNRLLTEIEAEDLRSLCAKVKARGVWRDNVFVERLWRSVKCEEVYLRAYDGVAEARASIGRYMSFYNGRRPHSSLDGRTPDRAYFDGLPQLAAA